MYKYSVIVPVYNASQTIERCVRSIIKAGNDQVQIILINDCSKDSTLEIIRNLEMNYPNILVLNNVVNKGVSYTRNRGLEQAKGKYILFVDSDDYVSEDYVEAFNQILNQAPDSFVICGFINHDEKNNNRTDLYKWDDFEGIKEVSFKEQAELLYEKNLLQQLWNKVFVTRIIKENRIRFDETISIGEDFRFILQYLKKAEIKTITLLNYTLYHYMRDQDSSLMYKIGYERLEEPLINLYSMYQILEIPEEEIKSIIEHKRMEITELYAYLIMHNAGMLEKEKKRLIYNLDSINGKALYKKNLVLYWKERFAIVLKKIGIRK